MKNTKPNFNKIDRLINEKLKFIYKGGTTMSIIFMKYNEISNNMFSEYEDYFKRSDSDYSLQLDWDTPNFNRYYQDLVILNYNILQRIKMFRLMKHVLYLLMYWY